MIPWPCKRGKVYGTQTLMKPWLFAWLCSHSGRERGLGEGHVSHTKWQAHSLERGDSGQKMECLALVWNCPISLFVCLARTSLSWCSLSLGLHLFVNLSSNRMLWLYGKNTLFRMLMIIPSGEPGRDGHSQSAVKFLLLTNYKRDEVDSPTDHRSQTVTCSSLASMFSALGDYF